MWDCSGWLAGCASVYSKRDNEFVYVHPHYLLESFEESDGNCRKAEKELGYICAGRTCSFTNKSTAIRANDECDGQQEDAKCELSSLDNVAATRVSVQIQYDQQ